MRCKDAPLVSPAPGGAQLAPCLTMITECDIPQWVECPIPQDYANSFEFEFDNTIEPLFTTQKTYPLHTLHESYLDHLRKQADLGDAQSQSALAGRLYFLAKQCGGPSSPQNHDDLKTARLLFQRVGYKDSFAMFRVATMYIRGEGGTIRSNEAAHNFTLLASRGCCVAMYNLALMELKGQIRFDGAVRRIGSHYAKTPLELLLVSSIVHAPSAKLLACVFARGIPGQVERDLVRSKNWIIKSVAVSRRTKHHDAQSIYWCSWFGYFGMGCVDDEDRASDKRSAVELLKKASALGDLEANHTLALMYKTGAATNEQGDPDPCYPIDLEEARRLSKIGADSGHRESCALYCHMLRHGLGGPEDPVEEAIAWEIYMFGKTVVDEANLECVAHLGYGEPEEMLQLAQSYKKGTSVFQKDDEKSQLWLHRALRTRHPEALFVLANQMYYKANCAKERQGALAYWKTAARRGHLKSQQRISDLFPQHCPQEILKSNILRASRLEQHKWGGEQNARTLHVYRENHRQAEAARAKATEAAEAAARELLEEEEKEKMRLQQKKLKNRERKHRRRSKKHEIETEPLAKLGEPLAKPPTKPPPELLLVAELLKVLPDDLSRTPPESTVGGTLTCSICFVNAKDHLAFPCGHQCGCEECTKSLQICPICREPVTAWVRVRVA